MDLNKVIDISVQDLNSQIKTKQNIILIDVREPIETEICSLKTSLFVPLSTFYENIVALEKNNSYVVLCKHGVRSSKAVEIMLDLGFKNVKNLKGGIIEWADKIDQSMSIY